MTSKTETKIKCDICKNRLNDRGGHWEALGLTLPDGHMWSIKVEAGDTPIGPPGLGGCFFSETPDLCETCLIKELKKALDEEGLLDNE